MRGNGRWDFVDRFGGDAGGTIPSRYATVDVGGASTVETMTASPTGKAMRLTGGTTNNDYMNARLISFRAWNVEVLVRQTFGASEVDSFSTTICVRGSPGIGAGLVPAYSIQCDLDVALTVGDLVTLQKGVAGSNTGIANTPFTASTTSRWVRFIALGNNFYIRTWEEGSPEPSAWTLTGSDSSTYLPNTGNGDNTYVSLMIRNRVVGVTNLVDFDQIYIRNLGS